MRYICGGFVQPELMPFLIELYGAGVSNYLEDDAEREVWRVMTMLYFARKPLTLGALGDALIESNTGLDVDEALERLVVEGATLGEGDVSAAVLLRAEKLVNLHNHVDAITKPPADEGAKAVVLCLADVEPEPIEWLWRSRIALGKLSIIAGHPGLGKSTVTLDMAARVSTGAVWPDGSGTAPQGDVLLISAEDDPADTIRPRLDVARANTARVHLLKGKQVRERGQVREVGITLEDLPVIESTLTRLPQCKLVIVDPIGAFMGASDSHSDAEVRGLLAPFAALAARRGIAVVIVAHLNKSSGQSAQHRISGSIGFVAAARAAWVVTADPDDEDKRLFASVKNNLAANPGALAFRLRTQDNSDHAAVEWIDGVQAVDIESLVGGSADAPKRSALEAAREFLKEELKDGPVTSNEMVRRIREAGHSKRTVDDAKALLKIDSLKVTANNTTCWVWCLPEHRNRTIFSAPLQSCNLAETPPAKPVQGSLLSKVARLQGTEVPGNLAVPPADTGAEELDAAADSAAMLKTGKRPVLTLVQIDEPPSGNGRH